MPKTPDEIKKGLECCMDYQNCTEGEDPQCPYYDVKRCMEALLADALAYIQQLESKLECSQMTIDGLTETLLKCNTIIKQLEAERDAAVRDLAYIAFHADGNACDYCDQTDCELGCALADKNIGFKWRGVQKEE